MEVTLHLQTLTRSLNPVHGTIFKTLGDYLDWLNEFPREAPISFYGDDVEITYKESPEMAIKRLEAVAERIAEYVESLEENLPT